MCSVVLQPVIFQACFLSAKKHCCHGYSYASGGPDACVCPHVLTGALEIVGEMKSQGVPFSKDSFTLAFATCYKLVRASITFS